MSQPFDNRDYDVQKLAAKDAEIARLKAIVEFQKEALDRWAASCDCEDRAREATK